MTADNDPPDRLVAADGEPLTDPSVLGTTASGSVTVAAGNAAETLARYAAPAFIMPHSWFRHTVTVTSYGGSAGGDLYLSWEQVEQSDYPTSGDYPANWLPLEADAIGEQQSYEGYSSGSSNFTLHNQTDGSVTIDWTVVSRFPFDALEADILSYR